MIPLTAFPQEHTDHQNRTPGFLYYTYFGPVISAGKTTEERGTWSEDKSVTTEKYSGHSFSPGIALNIFTENMSGEFAMQYTYYTGDIDSGHLHCTSALKYYFRLNGMISVYPGLGIYLETPPSTGKQNGGAGVYSPAGFLFILSDTLKIYTEGFFRYGYLGTGTESTRFSYGANAGVLFRAGNI